MISSPPVKFGARTNLDTDSNALAKDSNYLAQCDGYLSGYCTNAGAAIIIYAEAGDSTPDVVAGKAGVYLSTGDGHFNIAILKNEYVKVTASAGTLTMLWTPIGNGGLVKQ